VTQAPVVKGGGTEDERKPEPMPEHKRKRKPNLVRAGWLSITTVLGFLVGVAVASVVVGIGLEPQLPLLASFVLSFLVGTGGALVYLAVLLVTDNELSALNRIWESEKLSRDLMIPLFLFSGGLVASMAQVSSGGFTTADVWSTFLLGFGWLGAMSGVGGSTTAKASVAEVNKKTAELKAKDEARNASRTEVDAYIDDMKAVYERKVKELRDQLAARA